MATALVTGGAIRVGRIIALGLAKAGYNIALHYYGSQKQAENTQKDTQALGVKCTLYQADLSNESTISSLISDVYEKESNLEILINSASLFEPTPFLETSLGQYNQHMDLNLKAPFFLSQQFANYAKKGTIINILDSKIDDILKVHFTYILTKKALADLTKMMAKELAPNIHVHGLALGAILPSGEKTQEDIAKEATDLPLKKLPNGNDITQAILQLINSPFLTGEILYIDAGRRL